MERMVISRVVRATDAEEEGGSDGDGRGGLAAAAFRGVRRRANFAMVEDVVRSILFYLFIYWLGESVAVLLV